MIRSVHGCTFRFSKHVLFAIQNISFRDCSDSYKFPAENCHATVKKGLEII
jgi:hypothetical protein